MTGTQAEPRMPFGRHIGQPLAAVPTQYLGWVCRACDTDEELHNAIHRELERRGERPSRLCRLAAALAPAVQWQDVLREWYRGLALSYHPDRGGSVEAMKVVNDAYRRLQKLIDGEQVRPSRAG